MPAVFEGPSPHTPNIYRMSLVCDHCRHQSLRIEVPLSPKTGDPRSVIINEALRHAERQGWQWDSPGEGAYQVVTCRQCLAGQDLIRRVLVDVRGVHVSNEEVALAFEGTPGQGNTFTLGADFITDGLRSGDVVQITVPEEYAGSYRLVAHSDVAEQIRQQLQQAERDPDYQVFIQPGAEQAIRLGDIALPWDGSRPGTDQETYRSEVMGEWPDTVNPEPPVETGVEDRVGISGGTIFDRQGRRREFEPREARVPPGRHTVGIDLGVGEDMSMAQVLIDGKPTGVAVPLNRPKIGPLRKSKWERLMEDDDEPCQ